MNILKNKLIALGYRYFVYANCQYFDDGKEITHYNLHFANEYIIPPSSAVPLDSEHGDEILVDFLSGLAKIYLLQNITMLINKSGVLCEHEDYKTLKIELE